MRRGVTARRRGRAMRRRGGAVRGEGGAAGMTPRGWGRMVGRCWVQEGRQDSMARAVLRNRALWRRGACLGAVKGDEDSTSNLE